MFSIDFLPNCTSDSHDCVILLYSESQIQNEMHMTISKMDLYTGNDIQLTN